MAQTNCGTVTLTEGDLSDDDISLSRCSLSTTEVSPGEGVTATVSVQNSNSTTGGQVTLAPTVGGSTVGETTVTLNAGESTRIEADIPASALGVGSNQVGWVTTSIDSGGGGISPPDQPIVEPQPVDGIQPEPVQLSETFR